MRISITYFLLCVFLFLTSFLQAQSIDQFILVNAASNQDIMPLQDGSVVNLTALGTALNVRAVVNGAVGSVRFGWDGNANFQMENTAPYALAGDSNGNYNSWTPGLGSHTLTATAYAGQNASGAVLHQLSINFMVIEDVVSIELPNNPGTGEVFITGERKKWHKITLSFDGPAYSELDGSLNPFLDYRLVATFTKGNKSYQVPGYFAADGNAAETSANAGNVWRVHFAPDETGDWNYSISYRIGANIAVSTNMNDGTPVPPIDGQTGTLSIDNTDKTGRDNRAKGRLQYVGQSYLQYAETGEYFIKGGADAPENFLAYEDFDNTSNVGGRRKSWAPHAGDWNNGDPSWQNGKGTEIIGAVNYLAAKGLNVFSFLTMNIEGDDENVFPYVANNNFRRLDCSKLDQWEIVFEHADQLGMYLHFKTQETENDQLLDGGDVGIERQLYYRELIARFGHHLALNWNTGEENTQTTAQQRAMAQWFEDQDPYNHHRVIHTYPNDHDAVYGPLVGNQSAYTGASIQTHWNQVHRATRDWIDNANAAGKAWVVANDEQGNANTGVPPDPGYPGYNGSNPDLDDIRKEVLWGNLIAGGAGVEYYFGYQLPESDLSLQDYRSRDLSWDYVRHALSFFSILPVTAMDSQDDLVDNGWCFAQPGQTYAIYLKDGGSSTLELPDNATYSVQWYNPRTGIFTQGAVSTVTGPMADLGAPPSNTNQDWAILVTRNLGGNAAPTAQFTTDRTSGVAPLAIQFDASASVDTDGTISSYAWNFGDGNTANGREVSHTYLDPGTYIAQLTVTDNDGAIATATRSIEVSEPTGGPCETPITLFSRDFPYQNTNFYLDDFTGTDLLAVDPNTHQSAEVAQAFPGPSCTYDITFHGVGEKDGRSRFKLFVNGHFLGDWRLPLSGLDWELGANYNNTFYNIPVKQGDEIKVYAEVATDGTEFSRGRWLKIDFKPVEGGSGCAAIWEEQDGLVVIEMENNILTESWESSTEVGGFSGNSYIQWTGGQHFNATGNGVLNYAVQIHTPGTYVFDWRVGVGFGNSSTEHNDSWLKIEGDNFYAIRSENNSQVKPRPACNNDPDYNCPDGSSTNGFFKNYGGPISGWSWQSRTYDHAPHAIYADFDEPGIYNIEVNARSSFHRLDRMVLYQPALVNILTARQLSNPETLCTSADEYQLQFIVGDGNQALANAAVTVNGATYLTQADGTVTIPNISIGTVNYQAALDGYTPQNGQVQLTGSLTVLITLDMLSSVTDVTPDQSFLIYPNPAQELLNVELSSPQSSTLSIYSMSGQLLLQQIITEFNNPVNIATLPQGSYLIEIIGENWTERQLFIKG